METELSPLMKQLLESGVHFGHQTKRWNPRMARFIFGERQGIYIIDLEKTVKALEEASQFLRDLTSRGEMVLFVGTKKQAKEIIRTEASRCGMFCVFHRWLGGTLTNFSTIRKSAKKLLELKLMKEQGVLDKLTKKESARISKEMARFEDNLGGILDMDRLPGALFIIDPKNEETAVKEANRLSIPIVALCDTNCDPDKITCVIPGNDDSIRSISLITSLIASTILEGRNEFSSKKESTEKPAMAQEMVSSTKPEPEVAGKEISAEPEMDISKTEEEIKQSKRARPSKKLVK